MYMFWDIVGAPWSFTGIPTMVRQEETPKVSSFLPISQGPISNRRTPNSINHARKSRISIKVVLTSFSPLLG